MLKVECEQILPSVKGTAAEGLETLPSLLLPQHCVSETNKTVEKKRHYIHLNSVKRNFLVS